MTDVRIVVTGQDELREAVDHYRASRAQEVTSEVDRVGEGHVAVRFGDMEKYLVYLDGAPVHMLIDEAIAGRPGAVHRIVTIHPEPLEIIDVWETGEVRIELA